MADLSQYDPIFQAAGDEWDVDPTVLKALVAHESGGNANARGKSGEVGLGQIMPGTQRHLGVTDPTDPQQSIFGAAKYLNEALIAEHENPAAALRYYNGGPGWRGARTDPNYPASVGGQYKKYAQASTGTVTDATPAPPAESDPYGAALKAAKDGATAPPAAPATSVNAPDDDPYSKALEAAKAAPERPPGPSFAPDPPGSAKAADWGIPQPPSGEPTTPAAASPPPSIGVRIGDWIGDTATKIGAGARQGYQSTPNLLTPDAQAAVQNVPIVGDLAGLASLGLKASGGLFAAGQAGVAAAGDTASPGLGRDLAAGMEVAPVAMIANPLRPGGGAYLRDRMAENRAGAASALASREAPLSPEFKANPLAPDYLARTTPPAAANVDVPGQMRSAGAMGSPASVAGITPKQELAYRSTAEGQKLLEPQPAGEDLNAYVPGVQPTTAEIDQTVNASRELKTLQQQAPKVSEAEKQISRDNNEARQRYFENIAGSDVTVANARAARAAQAETDLRATWKGKTDADVQPVLDTAAEIKASPDWHRPLVRNAVGSVTGELADAEGKLITDPEQLYGVRKHLDDLMSKESAADDPKSVRAFASLGRLKEALDTTIEAAAPGFKQYLKNFADASRPIEAMETLLKHEPKLYDAQNRMQYSRVQTMMRQIVDSRSAPGVNAYKSIPDETMTKLWALRDDLRRAAGADELARTKGSDTAQNLGDAAKEWAKLGGTAVAHGAANLLAPGFGSMGLSLAKNALAPLTAARTMRRQTARGMEMLYDKRTLKQPPNLLTPP